MDAARGFVLCWNRFFYHKGIFFAINKIQWDYAPSGKNLIQNNTIEEDEWVQKLLSYEFSMQEISL